MNRKSAFLLAGFLAAGSVLHLQSSLEGCGPLPVILSYLDANFWQPLTLSALHIFQRATPEMRIDAPFAGFSTEPASSPVESLRAAYRPLADGCPETLGNASAEDLFREGRRALEMARAGLLSGAETAEADLIEAKLDLREAECSEDGREILNRARKKLEAFLSRPQSPALASEARGWLGRVLYLSGDFPRAAKIYLDELERSESIHTRESLVLSLRLIYPHDGTDRKLSEHLEEFFDTPAHALFAVTLVTNPREEFERTLPERGEIVRRVHESVNRHPELFGKGENSDRLAVCLMRAAMFTGDPRKALETSRKVRADSSVSRSPEYLWLLGAAHHLAGDAPEALAAFRRLVGTPTADGRYHVMGWQGLAVSAGKLGFQSERLDALLNHLPLERKFWETETANAWDFSLFSWRDSKDLAYALDVEMPVDALEAYLTESWPSQKAVFSHPIASNGEWKEVKYSGRALVAYSLAVRQARLERYEEAARWYCQAGSLRRARRMGALAPLFAAASRQPKDPEAVFAYAAFLERHSTQVFFNDRLWGGMQRYVLEVPEMEEGAPRPAAEARFAEHDRAFLDSQEEYWRASLLFLSIAREATDANLRKRAAEEGLACLYRIRPDRFRREREMREMRREFRGLARNPSAVPRVALLFPKTHADTPPDPELQALR